MNILEYSLEGIKTKLLRRSTAPDDQIYPGSTAFTNSEGNFELLFVSLASGPTKDANIPIGNSYATFYYVNLGSGLPTSGGDPSVYAFGYDFTADTIAPVSFHVKLSGGIELSGGEQVASGAAIDTKGKVSTWSAPASDSVGQDSGHDPASFRYWYSLTRGTELLTGPFKPGGTSPFTGALELPADSDDILLAVYIAAKKDGIVWPSIHNPKNCPALLKALTDANTVLADAEKNNQSAEVINGLKNAVEAANIAAAPCIRSL